MAQPAYKKLSVAERIIFLQDRWDEIAASPEDVSVSDAQRAEQDRRRALHAAAPDDVTPWPEVRRRVRAKR